MFGGGNGVPGESRGQASARQLLDRTAALAALSDVVIAQKDEYQCELRGALRGMPVRLIVDHDGEVRECQLRYHSTAGVCIDLEYDPDRKPTSAGTAMPAWDEDDVVIDVGPSVVIDGSDAKKEHAAFLRLPPDLQARVLETMKRRRIMYFRSRPDEHDIHFHENGRELSDKPAAFAEVLLLAGEVARARGGVPPRPTRARDDDNNDDGDDDDGASIRDATKLAGQIAARRFRPDFAALNAQIPRKGRANAGPVKGSTGRADRRSVPSVLRMGQRRPDEARNGRGCTCREVRYPRPGGDPCPRACQSTVMR